MPPAPTSEAVSFSETVLRRGGPPGRGPESLGSGRVDTCRACNVTVFPSAN